MNNIEEQYIKLVLDILKNGTNKDDRTGTGTVSIFGQQLTHDMKTGFPILTTKKMPLKTIIVELLWFLRGDTNIKYLLDHNCHIWDGDCYTFYLKNKQQIAEDNIIETIFLENGSKENVFRAYTKEEFIEKLKNDDFFCKKWGDLGKIYGFQWRNWGGLTEDELYHNYLKQFS